MSEGKEEKKIDGTILRLDNVRLAFPQLHEAKRVNNQGDPAFSATFLISPKTNANLLLRVREATKKVAFDKWKDKAGQIIKALEAADKLPLHNGDIKSEYAGFAGNFYIAARTKTKPRIVDRDNKTMLGVADGKPYAGCYVNASVQLWAQDHSQFGKRINASLRGVQFSKDGDAFSGGTPADESEFEDLSDIGDEEVTGNETDTGSAYA